jgi:hypothetical protein
MTSARKFGPKGEPFGPNLRRLRLEFPGATRAGSAQKRNARHMGNNPRDFDMVIGLADELRRIQKESAAMLAGAGEYIPFRRRIGMKRAIRPGVRLSPLSLGRLALLARGLVSLAGMLEFSAVFGGRLSLARSAALSACSLALSACSLAMSARSASTSFVKRSIASACERMRRISVSLSSESSVSRSIHSLNQPEIPLSNLLSAAKS